jgi:hypothetical protein
MLPVKTPRTNRTFILPGGTEENNLPLEVTNDADGLTVFRSTWQLTDEERRWIAAGANIVLTVWGLNHPPVAMHVEKDGEVLGTAAPSTDWPRRRGV